MLKRLTFCAIAALAVSACAPSGHDAEGEPSNAPFGYEFAQYDEQAANKISATPG